MGLISFLLVVDERKGAVGCESPLGTIVCENSCDPFFFTQNIPNTEYLYLFCGKAMACVLPQGARNDLKRALALRT